MNFTKLTKEEQLTILANVAEDKGIVDNANFVVVNNVYLHKINEQKYGNSNLLFYIFVIFVKNVKCR